MYRGQQTPHRRDRGCGGVLGLGADLGVGSAAHTGATHRGPRRLGGGDRQRPGQAPTNRRVRG